jgi:serine/threonine protein kinase
MAVVWLARDERLGMEVALKFLPGMVASDPEALHDLRREITRGLRITHPAIVRVYDLHEDSGEGIAAIAMEYIDGPTLAEEKQRQQGRCFEVAEPLISWVRTLCDALAYVHEEAKVVHRDLKPRNLMLTAQGRLKITDFGIAATMCDSHSRVTQHPGSSGTPVYMSPQQAAGFQPKASDDVYALGATIYELLTSKPPFFRGSMAIILNQVASIVPPSIYERREELGLADRGTIPPEWEETVAACLAKYPEDRPASVREIAARLGLVPGAVAPAPALPAGPPVVAAPPPAELAPEPVESAAAEPEDLDSLTAAEPTSVEHDPAAFTPEHFHDAAEAEDVGGNDHLGEAGEPEEDSSLPVEAVQTQPLPSPLPRVVEPPRPVYEPLRPTPIHKGRPAWVAPVVWVGALCFVVWAGVALGPFHGSGPDRIAVEPALTVSPTPEPPTPTPMFRLETPVPTTARTPQPTIAPATPRPAPERKTAEQEILAASKESPWTNSLGMKFVPVPINGGPTGGKPVYFSIWDTRVKDYDVFVAETHIEHKAPDFPQTELHPVVSVSWEEAVKFCEWLTEYDRRKGTLPARWKYRLPSDHEWSCAVGIGDREPADQTPEEKDGKISAVYPWGTQWPPPAGAGNYDGSLKVDQFANTSPVGSFAANRYGLYDMGGNVWQWCQDWYSAKHDFRVVRGASWFLASEIDLRSSSRCNVHPARRRDYGGFRCVLEVSGG